MIQYLGFSLKFSRRKSRHNREKTAKYCSPLRLGSGKCNHHTIDVGHFQHETDCKINSKNAKRQGKEEGAGPAA